MSGLDPRMMDMAMVAIPTADIIERIRSGRIMTTPNCGRTEDPWGAMWQSRLIESLIVGIPIPTLYFDATDDNRWVVMDGSRRLDALRRFAVTKTLALEGLEYLSHLENKGYDEIPAPVRRRLRTATITTCLVRGDTPVTIRESIAKRVHAT